MLHDVWEGRGGDIWEKEEGWTVGGEGRGIERGTWVERKAGGRNRGKVESTAGGDVEEVGKK